MIVKDPSLVDKARRLRWFGFDREARHKYEDSDITEAGYKYHMNDIAAAIGLVHLTQLEGWNQRRREISEMYRHLLADLVPSKLTFVGTTCDSVSASHLCVVRVSQRDKVVDRLAQHGIGVGVHYKPNHYYRPFSASARVPLIIAEEAYRQILSLPLHVQLSDEDVHCVSAALRAVLAELD